MKCCKNVGPIDRAVRIIIGIAAIVLSFTILGVGHGAVAGILAVAVGVVMLATAAMGVCPLYLPLKVSTCGSGAAPR